jgi:hypothetical protein
VSDYNDVIDAALRKHLTAEEHQLFLALIRNLLGYANLVDGLGEDLLLWTTGFGDRRSLVRAREGLVAKKVLRFTPGKRGRGHRARYELLPAQVDEAGHEPKETAQTSAQSASTKKRAQKRAQKRAPVRARSKHSAVNPPTPLVPEGGVDDLLQLLDCLMCGQPVTAGKECGACGAGLRDAGTGKREVAAAQHRFAGWAQYVSRVWDEYPGERREETIGEDLAEMRAPPRLIEALIARELARRKGPGLAEGAA